MTKSRRSTSRQQDQVSSIFKPTQILLDEQFLLCASGQGCDSKSNICEDEKIEDRELNAIEALLAAYRTKVALVIDEPQFGQPSRVRQFYNNYLKRFQERRSGQTPIAAKVLGRWLSGRNGRLVQYKLPRTSKVNPQALEACNLKAGTLDPLLCELAIMCRGDAPVWTLDSDLWCASQFYSEIKPTCPAAALASVR